MYLASLSSMYLVSLSQMRTSLMPYFAGLFGMYIRKEHLPLHPNRCSSTVRFTRGTLSRPQLAINESHTSLAGANLPCSRLSPRVSGLSNLRQDTMNSNLLLEIAAQYKEHPVTMLHISLVERWLSPCCPGTMSTPTRASTSDGYGNFSHQLFRSNFSSLIRPGNNYLQDRPLADAAALGPEPWCLGYNLSGQHVVRVFETPGLNKWFESKVARRP